LPSLQVRAPIDHQKSHIDPDSNAGAIARRNKESKTPESVGAATPRRTEREGWFFERAGPGV